MFRLLFALALLATPALAAPKIATTITPLTGVVTELMAGAGAPAALMPTSAEPHDFTLRPSQIVALKNAEVVFAVGLTLEHWLTRVEGDFTVVNLGDLDVPLLPARNFDMSARTEMDPHLWLDPKIMQSWVLEITQTLVRMDPENTEIYRANELALLKTLTAASERIEALGARFQAEEVKLVVAHDAYQYLEARLGTQALGMLTDFNEARAGARSLSKISRLTGKICFIDNPEISAPEDLLPDAPRVLIDPIGAALAAQDDFVAQYYESLISPLEHCFTHP